jgi:hypothetical protein
MIAQLVASNGRVCPDDQAIAELRTALRGEVFIPGDSGYDDARRVWNGLIDKRPAAIVRCTGVADVIAAVGFARDHGCRLQSGVAVTTSLAPPSTMTVWSSTSRR